MATVARRELRRVLKERYDVGLASIDDPDLVWLSEQGSEGILPSVLDAEGIAWRTITIT